MSADVVVDCSALFDYVVTDVGADLETALSERAWHAPQLIDFEFLATLRRHVIHDQLGSSDATERLSYFSNLSIERHSVELLRHRVWSLRHSFSAYEASYVALAEALGIPLVTSDLRLARTAARYCDVLTP